MKNIFKIVFVIIGALIGAGFVSGQEIHLFFFRYGLKGLIGIAITSIIIGIIIYQVLKIIKDNQINTYREFLDKIIINVRFKSVINCIINIFILTSFYIMIAGLGAYIQQEFGINNIYGSIALSFLCYIFFQKRVNGIIKANETLIPILIIILIIIGLINIKKINFNNILIQNKNNFRWIISSILYASYNSIILIPILVTLKKYIESKNSIYGVSFISTIITIFLSVIIYSFLIKVDVNIANLEMPAVYAIEKISHRLRIVYGFIILVSIFTTAITSGMSFLVNTTTNNKNYKIMSVCICVTAVIFSNIGFSNLVKLIYPVFGYLGIIQIFLILRKNIAKK